MLAVLVVLAFAAPAASAQVTPVCDAHHTFTASSYDSRVCDVPDFDQRREAATLTGDGRTVNVKGLPANGSCHCVPTSFTDLLGYYSQKGVDVLPPAYNWTSRPGYVAQPGAPAAGYLAGSPYPDAEITRYNNVTTLIGVLGNDVEATDAKCGTSFSTVIKYQKLLTDVGFFPHARFVMMTNGVDGGTPRAMATIMSLGGTVSLAYGRYSGYKQSGTTATATGRPGGHVVALEGVSGGTSAAMFRIRDPWTDDGDRFRQSAFTLDTASAQRIQLTVGGMTNTRWRWGPIADSGNQRVLDGWMTLYPTYLVTVNGKNLGFMPGLGLNRQDGKPVILSVGAKIVDAALLVTTGEIAYVTEGSRTIRAVDIVTRRRRALATAPPGVRDLEADPTGRRLFALGRRQLVSYDKGRKVLDRLDLPRPADAMAYDASPDSFAAERLALVSRGARTARIVAPWSLKVVSKRRLPAGALAGRGRLSLQFADGRLHIRRGSAGAVRTVGARSSGPALRSRILPGAAGDHSGFVVTDPGTIVTIRDGRLVELGRDGRALADSPFTGPRMRGRVVAVGHSGGDLLGTDPATVLDERIPWDPEFPEMSRDGAPPPPPPPPPDPDPPPAPEPKPNLVIADLTGGSVTVRNSGNADAGAFEVHVSRSSGGAPEVLPVRGLAAGESVTLSFACQRVETRVTVDARNTVAESSEDDNTQSITSDCR